MVGKRKVVCLALLAAACGGASRASNEHDGSGEQNGSGGAGAMGGSNTRGGSSSTSGGQTNGGSSSGGSLGGSAPTSGRGGSGGTTECPVTPASGTWVGYFGVDPFAFELSAGDSELSGSGCIGGPPGPDNIPPFACAPLTILADRGRSVDFSWDTRAGGGYLAELSLTLSPDRTAMAGSFWNSWDGTPPRESEPADAVLVLYDGGPVSDATECSGGEPSGECFEHPLRADSIRSDRYTVAELGGGDLLLVWLNQRAIEERVAVARFDAANDEWREPTFVDTDKAQYELPAFSTNRRGEGLLALPQPGTLAVKHYDVATDGWSELEVVVAAPSTSFSAKAAFVQDDGDATLIGTARTPDGGESLFASEHDATTHAWGEPIPLGDRIAPWLGAAGDAAGNVVVVWISYPSDPEAPEELRFSRRSPNGAWSDPAILHTSQTQILRPAVAIGAEGEIVATWEEWRTRIGSSSYSPGTNAWSQPVTVTAEQFAENRRVAYTEDGRLLAYFYRDDLRAYEVSELDADAWSVPEQALEADALGLNYSIETHYETIDVTRLGPATDPPIPALERATCDGY